MPESENIGSFLNENRKLVLEYLETRAEIYKLRLIRVFSKLGGYFAWIIISLFLLSLFAIFLGLTTGFWLSELTGSYTKGFGLTALIILVLIMLMAVLRKVLFVNPLIRAIIRKSGEVPEEEDEDN